LKAAGLREVGKWMVLSKKAELQILRREELFGLVSDGI
jgi:hypothetical protein